MEENSGVTFEIIYIIDKCILGLNEIEHTETKASIPQTNGICERFHKTILQEFYQAALRRKLYPSVEVPADLDEWISY
jgi:transposase InsO family protein